MDINIEIERLRKIVDEYLVESLKNIHTDYSNTILESIKYSLFTGGKRIRPILSLKVYELLSNESSYNEILPYAASIEMIHTYSLIHDDLPAMDDDDFRRGRLSNHKKFGEAMAILAGDGLLNFAFENILLNISNNDSINKIIALKEIAMYSGVKGMIGGQVVDLHLEHSQANSENITYMYKCKTGGLIMASTVVGAIIAGADKSKVEEMRKLGLYLGLAYQIKDDFLDLEEDNEINKVTYISTLGYNQAKKDLDYYTNKALEIVEDYPESEFFKIFIEKLKYREF